MTNLTIIESIAEHGLKAKKILLPDVNLIATPETSAETRKKLIGGELIAIDATGRKITADTWHKLGNGDDATAGVILIHQAGDFDLGKLKADNTIDWASGHKHAGIVRPCGSVIIYTDGFVIIDVDDAVSPGNEVVRIGGDVELNDRSVTAQLGIYVADNVTFYEPSNDNGADIVSFDDQDALRGRLSRGAYIATGSLHAPCGLPEKILPGEWASLEMDPRNNTACRDGVVQYHNVKIHPGVDHIIYSPLSAGSPVDALLGKLRRGEVLAIGSRYDPCGITERAILPGEWNYLEMDIENNTACFEGRVEFYNIRIYDKTDEVPIPTRAGPNKRDLTSRYLRENQRRVALGVACKTKAAEVRCLLVSVEWDNPPTEDSLWNRLRKAEIECVKVTCG